MNPDRRDRFFLSLRQLEQRLASESSPIKKGRFEQRKELAGTEPRSSNASPCTECGFAVANTAIEIKDEIVGAHDIRSTGAYADMNAADASNSGLAAINATFRCVLADANPTSICKAAHVPDLLSCDANGQPDTTLSSGSGLASAEAMAERVHAGHYLESAGVGLTGMYADKTAGAKASYPRLDTSTADGVHIVNVDCFLHGGELPDSVLLCEEEEKIYDALFSGNNNEECGSLLQLSAHWNPWEIQGYTCESESHPPAEFLSSPMTNDIKGAVDGIMPESSAKSLCQELHGQEEDDLQYLTRLCGLLGLGEHARLQEAKGSTPACQMDKLFHESRLDSDALYHEHPSSTFYSNVAKVDGGENSSKCAQALDFWLERLWNSQREPYCCALLLLAKASLQEKKGMAEGYSGKFPSVIQEWLALQHVADEQTLL